MSLTSTKRLHRTENYSVVVSERASARLKAAVKAYERACRAINYQTLLHADTVRAVDKSLSVLQSTKIE